MNLVNDYFLLYHGTHLKADNALVLEKETEDELFFELSSLFLSVTRKEFDAMVHLRSFSNMCEMLGSKKVHNIDELYTLQHTLIEHIITRVNPQNIGYLHAGFDYLLSQEILNHESHEKLLSLFDPCLFKEDKEIEVHNAEADFQSQKYELMSAVNELKSLTQEDEALDDVVEFLNRQKFSIGITGVMNAGKSTMLNALMKKEILGTSVVPETANLTIVKYSKEPKAKVVYWNKAQWLSIEHSACEIKAMRTFVDETKASFKDNLDEYILEKSREDEINIDELSKYTSAASDTKSCNLVKYVELGSELHFLHEGIEIVDTPGLDDIVIQREEITKEYISQCDLMIHLMNVSQSATAKDIDFIVDALVFQNISKVLIVITRVDMVSKEDVLEVVDYTKKSLQKRLHELNVDSKFDFVLKNIEFVSLSGQMALYHRTGRAQEAIDAGYTLEDSGILKIENYLNRALFSKDNDRTKMIIYSARHKLIRCIENALASMQFELSLATKSKDELRVQLKDFEISKQKEEKRLKLLTEQVMAYKEELYNFVMAQNEFLDKELKKLQKLIGKRLMDEVSYTFEKEGEKTSSLRVKNIVEMAIKHGLLDIIRDYRYLFVKRFTKVIEILKKQYSELFNEKDDFSLDGFEQGFLVSSNELLIKKLSISVSKSSVKDLTALSKEFSFIIQEEFTSLEAVVKTRALRLCEEILEEFSQALKIPILSLEKRLKSSEDVLLNQLENINSEKRASLSIDLHKSIKMVQALQKRLNL